MTEDEPEIQWAVSVSDLADADIEKTFNYLVAFLEVKKVEEWVRGLYFAIFGLGDFPGPYANPIDEEPSKRRGQEVRHFLYRGPKKRPHSFVYKIFYRAIAPKVGDLDGTIIIERIVHGSSNWPDESTGDESES